MFFAPEALAKKGAMEIGLGYFYQTPQMDMAYADPGQSFNLIFHYWLNDTTSIEVEYERITIAAPIDIDGDEDSLDRSTDILEIGLRYRPELDFFLRPYFELAVGYESWGVTPPSGLPSRNGGTPAYMAGLGMEYMFFHSTTLAVGGRYRYMPMRETMEREAVSVGPDDYDVIEREDLENVGYLSFGAQLVYRFN